jgi:hypothetical protein
LILSSGWPSDLPFGYLFDPSSGLPSDLPFGYLFDPSSGLPSDLTYGYLFDLSSCVPFYLHCFLVFYLCDPLVHCAWYTVLSSLFKSFIIFLTICL